MIMESIIISVSNLEQNLYRLQNSRTKIESKHVLVDSSVQKKN